LPAGLIAPDRRGAEAAVSPAANARAAEPRGRRRQQPRRN